MTGKTFLPEWHYMNDGAMYRPLYRLFAGDNWRMVCENKVPVRLPSAREAIAAAKAHVERVLNPQIRSETKCEPEPDMADVLGIEEWRQRREQEAEAERQRIFPDGPSTIFLRGGKTVAVETRRRRA